MHLQHTVILNEVLQFYTSLNNIFVRRQESEMLCYGFLNHFISSVEEILLLINLFAIILL